MNKSQKNLAIFLPTLGGGGAERVMLNLATGIAEKGFHVDLVLSQAEGPFLCDLPKSVNLIELNSQHLNRFRTLSSLPALVSYLKHSKPCALLSGLHANIIALWARFLTGVKTKIVVSEHNTFSLKNQNFPAIQGWMMRNMVGFFYPMAECIIAVSDGVANDLAKETKIPRDRIRVIYNPVITKDIEKKTLSSVDHPWFRPGAPPVILAVGRLTAQKDFVTLVKAFSLLRRTHKARLLIIGEGEERGNIEQLVKELSIENDVSIPGFISNPYPFMVKSSLFVLSSQWEGLPTVLVEALYCGCSIVATDCPSGSREILRDGLYGKLVPVKNVSSLTKALKETIDSPLVTPDHESWQPFTMENIINQYMSILL